MAPNAHDDANAAGSSATPAALGNLLAVIALAFALLPALRGGRVVLALLALATLLAAIARFAPHWLRPMLALWMGLGRLMGRIVSPVVLGAMFWLMFVPVALLMRWRRRDELRLRRVHAASYWIRREDAHEIGPRMRNQF